MRAEGYAIAPDYKGADLVLVNTCGFLDSARDESLDHWEDWFKKDERNVRQVMNELRCSQEEPEWPEPPTEVEGEAPENVNIFSDGAVKCPTHKHLAFGGFGIWWPGKKRSS